MKNLLIMGIIALAASCSKPNGPGLLIAEPIISQSESIIFDAAKKIDQNATEVFDLGSVGTTPIKKKFNITNTTGSNLKFNFADLQSQIAATARFSLNLNTATACGVSLKTNKSCSFELILSKVNGESYDAISTNIIDVTSRGANQEFGGVVFTGVKLNDVSSEVPLVSIMRIDRLADSFIIPAGSSIKKRFYIGNIGSKNLQTPGIVSPLNGAIEVNSCSELISIKPNGTCFFEIRYTSNLAPELASYNSEITFTSSDPLINTAGLAIQIAITNQPMIIPVISANFNQVGSITDLSTSNGKTRLYLNNTGSTAIDTSTITIPSQYTIVGTSCLASLKIGKTCFYDLTINPTQAANSTAVIAPITIGTTTFGIKAGDPAIVNSPNPTTTCSSGFSMVLGSCVPSNISQACTMNGGAGLKQSVDGGLTYGACLLSSCSDNRTQLAVDQLSCDPILCTPENANIINAIIVSGNLVSGCLATSCDPGFTVQSGNCIISNRSCIISDLSNLGISQANVATVAGTTDGLDFSSCSVASCSNGYTYSSVLNSCNINIPIVVSATPAQELIYTKNVSKPLATNSNTGAVHEYSPISTTGITPATAAQVGLSGTPFTQVPATSNIISAINTTSGTDTIVVSGTSDVSLANCNFISIDLGSNCSPNNLIFSFNMKRNDIVGSTLSYLLNGFEFLVSTKLNTVSQVSSIMGYTDGIGSSISYNGKLYFSANTSNGLSKLFRYDDSLNIIEQVSNTTGDPLIQDVPTALTIFNNKLYFNAMSPGTMMNPRSLYEYDSVTNVVKRISNTVLNTTLEDNPTNLKVFDNKLYFAANTSYNGVAYNKLFSYDGISVNQVTNIAYQYGSDNTSAPNLLGIISDYNNKLYVVGSPYGHGKLYEYDQNTSLTKQISNIFDATYDNIQFLTKYNNKLFFKSGTTNGILWSYDGTSINQIFNNDPNDMIVVNGKMYMRLKPVGSSRYKLFEYYESPDGLTKTLNQVSNIRGNATSIEMTNATADIIKTKMISYNNKLYFVAQNSSGFTKLWQFDTVSRKLIQISNIVPTGSDEPQYMTIHNGKLYFAARTTTATTPVRLFVFDGL